MIYHQYSLKPLNTFGIDVKARDYAAFSDTDQLEALLKRADGAPALILGGGSNLLLTGDIDGWVLKNAIGGIDIVKEDRQYVYLRAGAGVNWHSFVLHCIDRGLGGVENLSLIPGNVGASPMQNIGAYGVELKDVFHCLEAYDISRRKIVEFSNADCAFGYRDSIFKQDYKGRYIILTVTFRLHKHPVIDTRYGAIEEELISMGITDPGIREVSNAVIRIRKSKLPDPDLLGNAGSFFKNPVVLPELYQRLKATSPGIPGFELSDGRVKVPAAWLIEQCGWKGYRKGDAGCHIQQPLVLVNYGNASGQDILDLSQMISRSVEDQFSVVLEREVNIFP